MAKVNSGSIFYFFMLVVIVFYFLNMSGVCVASYSPGQNLTLPVQQEQLEVPQQKMQELEEEPLSGPSFLEKAANFLYIIYDYIRKGVGFLLEKTIFQGNPKLAEFYGDVASFLASLTAVYLLLLLAASARKIIGVLLLLGWALFFVAIVVRW